MTIVVSPARRRWLGRSSATLLAVAAYPSSGSPVESGKAGESNDLSPNAARRLWTFGDSVLDSGHYNALGINPGQLIVRNDDAAFPEFRGRDLLSRGPAHLAHRARDGATVGDLAAQAHGVTATEHSVAIVSVGGNDLLRGLAADTGAGMRAFEAALNRFLVSLPIRPVMVGTVYDPTFGDDSRNFLDVPAAVARANHRRVNAIIAESAERFGRLADLHAHFLRGDASWFTGTVEPSLRGSSEVRRVFLAGL